jgi:FAD dependent oxidoreductase
LLCALLQTDAPRPDGGTGYPGLRLCPEVLGTNDGLAAAAYVRESRRIAAEFTVLETHVGVEARLGADHAEVFQDTVGVGSYRIDLHPSTARRGYLDIPTYPFQIPLGALLPQRLDNLLAAGKCLGVTHVTNGCYRLHPVEWNIGEAAGSLASFCLTTRASPRAVRSSSTLLADFQRSLLSIGVQLHWPEEIQTKVR